MDIRAVSAVPFDSVGTNAKRDFAAIKVDTSNNLRSRRHKNTHWSCSRLTSLRFCRMSDMARVSLSWGGRPSLIDAAAIAMSSTATLGAFSRPTHPRNTTAIATRRTRQRRYTIQSSRRRPNLPGRYKCSSDEKKTKKHHIKPCCYCCCCCKIGPP